MTTLPPALSPEVTATSASPIGFFPHGTEWVRADFHLHTRADKEFKYSGEDNQFVAQYVQKLKDEGIRLGVITNHNKFDFEEFKALRRKARKEGICLLPGVELSVNDGANGVHTLVVFSEQWIEDGQDYINQFLANAFSGRTPAQYENENGRSNDNIIQTLKNLENFHRDFFTVFAHVEAGSGLWNEIDGGRLQELAKEPLIQRRCLGFQKVRTHDKADAKCRVKVKQWWPDYPAELEGSDPKKIEEIGKGKPVYVKIGDPSFEAVKFALKDYSFRVEVAAPANNHSYVKSIRFEGGLLDGRKVSFSPHLNCIIGIRGSGKSAIIESLRYALGIELSAKADDHDYKEELVPHVLRSGGKVIVQAVDRHGEEFEVRRIVGHASSDVYVGGELRPGVALRETVITRPVYFGQKDLSARGRTFGHDLVEKLVGDTLRPIRDKEAVQRTALLNAIAGFTSSQTDAEEKEGKSKELQDVEFRLEQLDKHGVREKLEKRIAFGNDLAYCTGIEETAAAWVQELTGTVEQASEDFDAIAEPDSKQNEEFFKRYKTKIDELKATTVEGKALAAKAKLIAGDLVKMREELAATRDGLKEEFAAVERDLLAALKDKGVTSIRPEDYVSFQQQKTILQGRVTELSKGAARQKEKQETLLKALAALDEVWLEEFRTISASLDEINKAQPALQVTATFKGDKEAFKGKLEDIFKGQGMRKDYWQAITEKYADFGEIFKNLDEAAKLTKGKAETFKQVILSNLADLLSWRVPASHDVTYHGKALKSHSLGQRASAMMLFILSQKGKDLLIIDQPEDDLDSQTVYEEVVKLLRTLKPLQQFIFATHDANFPVLGDAETVSSCEATDEHIAVTTGSIDSAVCQERIVRIMEGGPEAFERRKTIYQIWSAKQASST
jgi:predicted ATPase